MRYAVPMLLLAGLTAGCTIEAAPRHRVVEREVIVEGGPVEEREVIVTEERPVERVEVIPVRPYREAYWNRGHWVRVRHGWVWSHGYWR